MKTLKTALTVVAGTLLAASCLSEKESYRAGFNELAVKYSYRYANNSSDTLYVQSYGDWTITREEGDWCALSQMAGRAGGYYRIAIDFPQNLTGQPRMAKFLITDNDHPNDAYAHWTLGQLATRGDGSLGNAALVKRVTGSDGSLITVSYDEYSRPVSFRMEKNGQELSDLKMYYSEGELIIDNHARRYQSKCGNDYQPIEKLIAAGDTVMFREQTEFNMFSNRYAFNIEQLHANGDYSAYLYLVPSITSLRPDSLHNADSLRYISGSRNGMTERVLMKPVYSQYDNRCQSLDVNQLLLGVDRCNPFMLLSFFRMARNTSIFSSVEVTGGQPYVLTTELNADKSVKMLTVKHEGWDDVTYDFEY